MSEQDPPQRGTTRSEADSTLLGVAPPRIDSATDSPQRSPVLVRAGTSVADIEPALLSRVALPSRSPRASSATTEVPPAPPADGLRGKLETARRYVEARPVIGMVVVPVLFALCLIAVARHAGPHTRGAVAARTRATEPSPSSGVAVPNVAAPGAARVTPPADVIAELERRAPGSLSSRELITLAEAHAQQKRAAANALRQKLVREPALAKDPATANQLLALSADPDTAPESLSAMAQLGPPGADLLYEVWTGTVNRTDSTELARALLYSPDVRPKASPALSVALELRVAESCEAYQAALPKALTDGDRRSLHLLSKLNAKHGCGPQKNADCFACLRAKSDELTATINAVKSRRPPSVAAQ